MSATTNCESALPPVAEYGGSVDQLEELIASQLETITQQDETIRAMDRAALDQETRIRELEELIEFQQKQLDILRGRLRQTEWALDAAKRGISL